ncbi:MAG TPA: hypothetical protein DDW84_06290 [Phycisphaerales bacterium]|nr:MAG: hypothetical protein A2Y13_10490 [Planctomycetes bacterium GWC2_45_44]HBG78438.1 hypothetical protein [Phycisphaerales bacterium]HBR20165.1 hypothetical protein [Phycisphaerales bacterium]
MKKMCVILCFFIVTAGVCYGKTASKKENNASKDSASSGPTVILKPDKALENPTPDFMYFVPLISPTLVYSETSKGNGQKSGLIACERKSTSKTFYVNGEFQMQGSGFHKNKFDSAGMIERNTKKLKKGKPLKNILGYIKFEGEGYGWIEVAGKLKGKKATATEVKVHFNGRGETSPVTVGLYSVKPVNGEYKYENKYNEIVARVNILTFSKSTDKPLMDIKVSAVYAEGGKPGFWGKLKGSMANMLIKPLEIDKLGNDTMLDFGCALFEEKEKFTFPKAKNLKENDM